MDLDWRSSVPASALFAALAMVRGRTLIEPTIESTLRPVVNALAAGLQPFGYQAEPLLAELVAQSTLVESAAELAETALNKRVGRAHDAHAWPLLAQAIEQLLAAFLVARPRAADELPLRTAPLGNQWEARGPGLLASMRRLSAADLLVPAAGVVLVHPVLGGGGMAHPQYNRVTFEGLLANPIPRLPEVLRLGWLLGQLNFDLPGFEEPLGRQRLAMVGPLALIPIVLAAAEDVELARADAEHLRLAADSWLGLPAAAEALGPWWETYRSRRPSWPAALLALETLLAAASGG